MDDPQALPGRSYDLARFMQGMLAQYLAYDDDNPNHSRESHGGITTA